VRDREVSNRKNGGGIKFTKTTYVIGTTSVASLITILPRETFLPEEREASISKKT
jgi:hypothetical protein